MGRRDGTPSGWLPAAAAVAVAAWGANQFTALASVYRARTDWSALSLAAMFSVYLVGLVPGLLLAGPVAARCGRRRTVRAALALSAAASALLAVPEESTVFAARLATGFAAGLVFVAGAAWLRELAGPEAPPEVSARRAMYATATGFAAGALASGVVAEWLPGPTVLPALAHALGCLLVLRATRRLPDTAPARTAPGHGVATGPAAASGHGAAPGHGAAAVRHPRFRYVVLPASPAVLGAATVGYAVLPPLVAHHLPGYAPLFSGLVAALTLATGALAQPFAARLDDARSARATLAAMATVIAGLLLGALAADRDSVGLVLAAAVVLGTGYGLTLGAGLHEVERLARRHEAEQQGEPQGEQQGEELAERRTEQQAARPAAVRRPGPGPAPLYQSTTSSGFLTPLLLAGTAGRASYPALLVGMAGVGVLGLAVTAAHSRRHLPEPPAPGKGEDSSVPTGPTPRSRPPWAE
ncbi:MFS transporter [Kitasatospora sp. NPDC089797]|uniref:MFS transporter n=1 Tax=Kitasatospora sp. NPDC089797 TaxID=3155298 RepID=UPI003447B310